jgi:hypothetical protein
MRCGTSEKEQKAAQNEPIHTAYESNEGIAKFKRREDLRVRIGVYLRASAANPNLLRGRSVRPGFTGRR